MITLVVDVFDSEFKAEEVRLDLLKRRQHPEALDDSLVVVRPEDGKVKLLHSSHLGGTGALTGGLLGTLVGVMLLNPVFAVAGLASGAALGGALGALVEAGIDEDFMNELAKHLKPGRSALCVPVKTDVDSVLKTLGAFDGKIFKTTLREEDEQKLLEKLHSARVGALGP